MSANFPSQRGCFWDGVYALPANLPGVAAAEINLKANDFAFVVGQGVYQCTNPAFPATWVSALAAASSIVLPFAGAITPAGLNGTYTADATGTSVAQLAMRYTIPTKWKLTQIRIFVYINTLVNPTVVTVRKNNVAVAGGTFNIPAGTTGLFSAAVNVDFDGTLGVDDYIDIFETVTGAGAGTMRMAAICYGTTAGTTGLLNEPYFIYAPAGVALPAINQYTTFASLFAATAPYRAANAPFSVYVNLDAAFSPFTVPDAGAFDFGGNATFLGAGTSDVSNPLVLAFDGSTTTINGICEISRNLTFDSVAGGGAAPWVNPTRSLRLTDGGGITGTTAPLISVAGQFLLDVFARSFTNNAGTSPIALGAGAACTVRLYDDAVFGVDSVSGAVGTTIVVAKLSPAANAGSPQTTFGGTLDYFIQSRYSLPLADYNAVGLPLVVGTYFLHFGNNPALATAADNNPFVEDATGTGIQKILLTVHLWATTAGVGNVTLDVLVNGVAVPGLTALAVNLANLGAPAYGVYAFAQGVPPAQSGRPLNASDKVSVRVTVPALGIAVTPVNIHCRLGAN